MRSSRRARVFLVIGVALALAAAGGVGWTQRHRILVGWRADALFAARGDAVLPAADSLKELYTNHDGDPVFLALKARLRGSDPTSRQTAAWALGRTFGMTGWRPHPEFLTAGECVLMRLAGPRTGRDDPPGEGVIREADTTDRIEANDPLLVDSPAEVALALLREARESQDPVFRWRAVRTLTFLAARDGALYDDLLTLLAAEQDPSVLQLLLRALGGFELDPPRRQVGELPPAALERALVSPQRFLRLAAARARGVAKLSPEQADRLAQDVRAVLGSAPDAGESPRQQDAWAEADALWLLADLRPDPELLRTVLSEEWLWAMDALESRRPPLLSAFRRFGPEWAPALEEVLDGPLRPQHFPDEIQANFTGPRWCEDDALPCPGELPWQALLVAVPERALAWLARPPSSYVKEGTRRTGKAWIATSSPDFKNAPRRLPLLRFTRGSRAWRAGARHLRSWPAAFQPTPTPAPAQLHWLRTTTNIAMDLCFAARQPEAIASLAAFARAALPPAFSSEQQAASLAVDLSRNASPRLLQSLARDARAKLRPRLLDERTPAALRAMICLTAFGDAAARPDIERTIRRLAAAAPCEEASDELLVLWTMARARRRGVALDVAKRALGVRLLALFDRSAWPYKGNDRDRALAFAMLEQISPEAHSAGRKQASAMVWHAGFEAVPLELHWGSFEALASELLNDSLETAYDVEPVEIDGLGSTAVPTNPLALALSIRTYATGHLEPLDLSLRLWSLAQHLADDPPQDDEHAAGWLLALEALEFVLATVGDPLSESAPVQASPEEVAAAKQLLQAAAKAR